MKAHPLFFKAKNYDFDAALKVVNDLWRNFQPLRVGRNETFIIVPVQKPDNKNQLPLAFAHAILKKYPGAIINTDIVSKSTISRKDSSAYERLLFRPVYEGKVIPNAKYLVCDDVLTHGASLNELKRYIEKNGGEVLDATTLAFPHYNQKVSDEGLHSARFSPKTEEIQGCLAKLNGNAHLANVVDVLNRYSIAHDLSDLTFSEISYLNAFSSANTLKNKLDFCFNIKENKELFASLYPEKFEKLIEKDKDKGLQFLMEF